MVKTFLLISVAAAGTLAAQTPNLEMKLGLWEITSTTKTAGPPAIDLSKVPPEMRAKLEATMKQQAAKMAAPRTTQSCVTKEKLEKNTVFDSGQLRESCKRTILTNTRTVVEIKVECASDKFSSTAISHFEMLSRESMKGSIKMSGTGSSDTEFTGKWLGESC